MKKYIYYLVFLVFCLGISFLGHIGLEIFTLKIILGNLTFYENSFVWQNWQLVHKTGSITLSTLAVIATIVFAPSFWQILYIDQKYGKPLL